MRFSDAAETFRIIKDFFIKGWVGKVQIQKSEPLDGATVKTLLSEKWKEHKSVGLLLKSTQISAKISVLSKDCLLRHCERANKKPFLNERGRFTRGAI